MPVDAAQRVAASTRGCAAVSSSAKVTLWRRSRSASTVVAQQLGGVRAEDREAARLEADDEPTCVEVLGERVDRRSEVALRATSSWPVEIHVSPQQSPAAKHDLPARVLEHLDRRYADLGMELVGERVGPEHDLAPRSAGARRPCA